jgi:hypothetical protein
VHLFGGYGPCSQVLLPRLASAWPSSSSSLLLDTPRPPLPFSPPLFGAVRESFGQALASCVKGLPVYELPLLVVDHIVFPWVARFGAANSRFDADFAEELVHTPREFFSCVTCFPFAHLQTPLRSSWTSSRILALMSRGALTSIFDQPRMHILEACASISNASRPSAWHLVSSSCSASRRRHALKLISPVRSVFANCAVTALASPSAGAPAQALRRRSASALGSPGAQSRGRRLVFVRESSSSASAHSPRSALSSFGVGAFGVGASGVGSFGVGAFGVGSFGVGRPRWTRTPIALLRS